MLDEHGRQDSKKGVYCTVEGSRKVAIVPLYLSIETPVGKVKHLGRRPDET